MPKFVIGNATSREPGTSPGPSYANFRKNRVEVLHGLGPEIQWLHSYVTGDKVYCVYLAPTKPSSGNTLSAWAFRQIEFPAVRRLIDATTAE